MSEEYVTDVLYDLDYSQQDLPVAKRKLVFTDFQNIMLLVRGRLSDRLAKLGVKKVARKGYGTKLVSQPELPSQYPTTQAILESHLAYFQEFGTNAVADARRLRQKFDQLEQKLGGALAFLTEG